MRFRFSSSFLSVSFHISFTISFSLSLSFSLQEKAELVFRSIDIDDNGFISRLDLEAALTKIYRLNAGPKAVAVVQSSAPLPPSDFSHLIGMYSFVCNPNAHSRCLDAMSNGRIPKAIDSIFGVADGNKDGMISLQEWKDAARKSKEIQSILDLSFR